MGHRRAWRILLLDALLASRSIATLDFVALPAVRAIRPGAVVGRCQWPATAIAARWEVSAGRVAALTPVLRARRSPVATPSSVAPPAVCAARTATWVLRPRRYPVVVELDARLLLPSAALRAGGLLVLQIEAAVPTSLVVARRVPERFAVTEILPAAASSLTPMRCTVPAHN